MINISRRRLARYAADQILAGQSAKKIAKGIGAVLIENGKTQDAELLARDVAYELEARGKLALADITTATNLSDSLKKELANFIKKMSDVSNVIVQENVDSSVIGGVRIETAIHAWDKTIKRQLTEIREAF
jgi:F0F1-type ATP synthase delta subunit